MHAINMHMRCDNVYDKRDYCTIIHAGSYLVNRGIWWGWIDDFPQRQYLYTI